MKKLRLLLIEDNFLLRNGIVSLLNTQKDFIIYTVTEENNNLIEKFYNLKIDIIILDIELRNKKSSNIVEVIRNKFPKAKLIIMDIAPLSSEINLFIKAGASGFILKEASFKEFLETIRAVVKGHIILPFESQSKLELQATKKQLLLCNKEAIKSMKMTKRELEIMENIGEGSSNIEIGKNMNISTYTVKRHISNIMEKLSLHSRLEVANYYYSSGNVKETISE